jgi:hypothetical protein
MSDHPDPLPGNERIAAAQQGFPGAVIRGALDASDWKRSLVALWPDVSHADEPDISLMSHVRENDTVWFALSFGMSQFGNSSRVIQTMIACLSWRSSQIGVILDYCKRLNSLWQVRCPE